MLDLDHITGVDAVLALLAALIIELHFQGFVDMDRVRDVATLQAFRLAVERSDSPELHGQQTLPFEEGNADE